MFNLQALLISGAAAVILLSGTYFYGRWDGSAACDARHAAAQAEHEKEVKQGYDKIDKKTPFNGDDAAVVRFLLDHTSF